MPEDDVFAAAVPPPPFFSIVGKSAAVAHIRGLIDKVKDLDAPVLIAGESGTGKELVARAIHNSGARRGGQFVAVNCGAIPDHLLESELFGYARGAFTGALRDKAGLIEDAHKGTFFLDEIGDLSFPLQAKLLRLLQEKEIRRVGENRMRAVDARFISATNKDLDREIEAGRFREDLFYRLRIVTIDIPPVRERRDDLMLLLNHFAEKYARQMGKEKVYFTPGTLDLLMRYGWPGNVREIQNEIQRSLILCGTDRFIREEYLSPKINPKEIVSPKGENNFFEAKAEFVRRFLNQALEKHEYNKARTAEEIGISRQGLFKLMKKHRIGETEENEKNT
jgi:transcriptional regulator with PAS, ATPase and Fis domain